MTKYTVEFSEEWGIGQSVNGTGKRAKVRGWYVVNPQGRRCRAFTGKNSEQQAKQWAEYCNEHFAK